VSKSVDLWLDLKSPYSFLAKDPAYALERELGVTLRLRPYALDILGAYNVADPKVAERGLRRIKYLYADVRRFANQRGMTIRGPQKIFDSSLANIGMIYAKRCGVFRDYHDRVFERFWRRELDIESPTALAAVLTECGADAAGFPAFLEGEGQAQLRDVQREAEAAGVFGVPSFLLERGELYWGREHLPRIRELLAAETIR
jgi:2-hydroxychromene-2-carboxylate isomerase